MIVKTLTHKKNNMKEKKFYIFRTNRAGVWFGNKKSLDRQVAVVTNARRLWYWEGAASLSQLAIEGVKYHNKCKFTMTIIDDEGVYLSDVIEILPCTQKAVNSINSVPIWKI